MGSFEARDGRAEGGSEAQRNRSSCERRMHKVKLRLSSFFLRWREGHDGGGRGRSSVVVVGVGGEWED